MKENWITKWHREDHYTKATPEQTPCENCGGSHVRKEGVYSVLRCARQRNCRVKVGMTCSKACE